jgi:hypothetical protein
MISPMLALAVIAVMHALINSPEYYIAEKK